MYCRQLYISGASRKGLQAEPPRNDKTKFFFFLMLSFLVCVFCAAKSVLTVKMHRDAVVPGYCRHGKTVRSEAYLQLAECVVCRCNVGLRRAGEDIRSYRSRGGDVAIDSDVDEHDVGPTPTPGSVTVTPRQL